jgi:uncharacterized RDD family membrane protein YckC
MAESAAMGMITDHEPGSEPTGQSTTEETVGLVTRAVSWLLDWAVVNLAAIIAGIGVALVLAIFPLANHLKPAFEVIAGSVYVLWVAAYFVVFWSMTGQTLGARVMQIRLVTASGKRVKPVRAFVRWVGMNLGMLFLGLGYVPILFGRRGLPDWLAKTLVLYAPQTSLAAGRKASKRAARGGARQRPSATSPELASGSPVPSDGNGDGGAPDPSLSRQPR